MQRTAMLGLWLVAWPGGQAQAQADTLHRQGDPSVVTAIEAETRRVYDSTTSWVFVFTRENLLGTAGAYGTEIQAGQRDGEVVRIIAGSWFPSGKVGVEFYRVHGKLVFTYESEERFAEVGGAGWKNFKGHAGWERRTYLVNGEVSYVETLGAGAPPVSAARLERALRRVLGAVASRQEPARRGAG